MALARGRGPCSTRCAGRRQTTGRLPLPDSATTPEGLPATPCDPFDAVDAALSPLIAIRDTLPSWLSLRLQMQSALLAQRREQWASAIPAWRNVVTTFARLYGADSTATAKWRIPFAEVLLAGGLTAEAREEAHRAPRP